MGRKSNAPERRDQIIRAFYDCLVASGHEKVTIKEIAKQAELPPGVIHYYFKSKDEIVSTLATTLVKQYSDEIQIRIQEAPSSEHKIQAAIEFIIDRLIFNLPVNRAFYNLIQMGFERDELHAVIRSMFDNYRKQVAGIFKRFCGERQSELLGASIVAITEGFSLQHMVDPTVLDREAVSRVIFTMVQDFLGIDLPSESPS